jgi:hypothetical protein
MSNQQMLAPCGIDCATCDIYVAAHDPEAARRLADTWKSRGSSEAKPEWFRCQGCRGDRSVRWCGDCKIADCCEEKARQNCSQCADFPCETYQNWIGKWQHHRAAYERLLAMRDEARHGDKSPC